MTQQRIILVIAFVWFFIVLGALAYFSSAKLIVFDPYSKLANAASNREFDDHFVAKLRVVLPNVTNVVIHFQQTECLCEEVADPHRMSVKELAKTQGYKNAVIDLTSQSEIIEFVPSTPAVAVINEDGKLQYLGPYSAGYSCAPGDGIVERFISNSNQLKLGATVVSDTLGCYCNT